AGDLGGLAEAQREQAGGEWIEAAGVAALRGTEQVAGPLQGLVGAWPARLVEQQDAVELAEFRAWAGGHRARGHGAGERFRIPVGAATAAIDLRPRQSRPTPPSRAEPCAITLPPTRP